MTSPLTSRENLAHSYSIIRLVSEEENGYVCLFLGVYLLGYVKLKIWFEEKMCYGTKKDASGTTTTSSSSRENFNLKFRLKSSTHSTLKQQLEQLYSLRQLEPEFSPFQHCLTL